MKNKFFCVNIHVSSILGRLTHVAMPISSIFKMCINRWRNPHFQARLLTLDGRWYKTSQETLIEFIEKDKHITSYYADLTGSSQCSYESQFYAIMIPISYDNGKMDDDFGNTHYHTYHAQMKTDGRIL